MCDICSISVSLSLSLPVSPCLPSLPPSLSVSVSLSLTHSLSASTLIWKRTQSQRRVTCSPCALCWKPSPLWTPLSLFGKGFRSGYLCIISYQSELIFIPSDSHVKWIVCLHANLFLFYPSLRLTSLSYRITCRNLPSLDDMDVTASLHLLRLQVNYN